MLSGLIASLNACPIASNGRSAISCASSSLSMPSNIAEGWARHSTPRYIHHLRTSQGSGAELETQVEVGRRVDLIEVRSAEILITDSQEIGRMLNGLIASLERTSSKDV